MMAVTKYLKSSAVILRFGGENTVVFSKVTFFYYGSQEKLVRVQVFHIVCKPLSLIVEKEH